MQGNEAIWAEAQQRCVEHQIGEVDAADAPESAAESRMW
jgi:hypothetical protein